MGVGVQATLLGVDASVGTGIITVDFGSGLGSVRNMNGLGLALGFNDGIGGLTYSGSVGENGKFTGPGSTISIHLGPGYQIVANPTYTQFGTARDAYEFIMGKWKIGE